MLKPSLNPRILAAFLLCFLRPLAAQTTDPDYLAAAKSGIDVLQQWYVPTTGLYRTTGWWNSANAITVLAHYDKLAPSKPIEAILDNTFRTARPPSNSTTFLNLFYDDEGWWALAWIEAYDATHDPRYLAMSQTIFADMAGGWDSTCNGGIWWTKQKTYKNAIANELFLSVAAHLANRTSGEQQSHYLGWANREWTWFLHSGMINSHSLINDGLTGACANNERNTWTYNQGVIVGGLAELSRLTSAPAQAALLDQAQRIAVAATTTLVDPNGILHESCESHCSGDAIQFKGIFVRNLALLRQLSGAGDLSAFLRANADSILAHARDPEGRFGQSWSSLPIQPAPAAPGAPKPDPTRSAPITAGTQSSALDAILAAASLQP